MNIRRYLQTIVIAHGQMLSNKFRAFLTAIGITIGVASVVVLLSLGQGVERYVVNQFNSLGSGVVMLFGIGPPPSEDSNRGQNFGSVLSDSDVELLSNNENLANIDSIAYTLTVSQSITYNNEDTSATIEGISGDYIDQMQLIIASGRGIDQTDLDRNERVIVVGSDIVTDLFNGENPVGESVRIGGSVFRVIGVLEDSNSFFVNSNAVLMPVTTAQARLGGGRTSSGDYPLSRFYFFTTEGSDVDVVVDQIDALLRADRGLSDDDRADFNVFAQSSFAESLTTITSTLTIFLGFIAGISLIVGGIGIMNIMLVTVNERTREIGLRKALGAQKADIILQFLAESIAIALLGGAVGTGIAIGLSSVASSIADFDMSVQVSSIILAVAVSTLIGGFFGVFPANRAASLNPIDALRYE